MPPRSEEEKRLAAKQRHDLTQGTLDLLDLLDLKALSLRRTHSYGARFYKLTRSGRK